MSDGKQMGMEWLREAWRQTQLCTHRRKTALLIRQGQEKVPGVHRNTAPRSPGCPGSNLRPAKTNVQERPEKEAEAWALLPDTEEGEKWELSQEGLPGKGSLPGRAS